MKPSKKPDEQVHDLLVRALVAEAVVHLRRRWGWRTCVAYSTRLSAEAQSIWHRHLRSAAAGHGSGPGERWTPEQVARADADWSNRCREARSAFWKIPEQEITDRARNVRR